MERDTPNSRIRIQMDDMKPGQTIMANTTNTNITKDYGSYGAPYTTVIKIESFCIPVICVIGFIGNMLSTITFVQRPLRKSPCSLYLALRGVSDNGFLSSLLLIWISSTFDLRLSQVRGICQLIIFMTYLFGCVSVWLCVFISIENVLLIYKPFIAKRICTARTSKICIFVLTIISVTFYQTSLWIMNADCSHDGDYSALTQALVYSDTLATLIVPTILISVLLCMITYKLITINRSKSPAKFSNRNTSNVLSRGFKMPLPITKITKMLFIVSLTFFILNVPSHVIRLRLLIGPFIQGKVEVTTTEAFVQTIFQLIYYLSFSVNIIVYILFGSNFRRTFKATFCCKKYERTKRDVPNEAVNLVRRNSFNGPLQACDKTLLMVETPRRCHSDCF